MLPVFGSEGYSKHIIERGCSKKGMVPFSTNFRKTHKNLSKIFI
jgi:hypothetical protein